MVLTYFFKDLHTLEAIRDYVIPELKTKEYVDIWYAGCNMGQEVYSLSMILNQSMGEMNFRNVRILATDIDRRNLFKDIINKASYPEEQVWKIPKGIFSRYFSLDDQPGYYRLNKEIRESVTYKNHSLLSLIPPRVDFGLILCKMILFNYSEEERTAVFKMIYDALIDGGFLALEQEESLPDAVKCLFEPVITNSRLFRKKPIL